ncbi:acetyl-coenzyme A synthetase [Algimonas arctica]|uniref:Acetyl-coenzyme A synthetase n=1 Tax=Algimonas arctica TaxID=1479486 RepID=A0A8J3G2H9_9PROT|nr:acetate--CoA ligase [Algimonas arctica]GHA95011.1 acetyl-coenzyme A synthetase [Algimonas arctica]
MTDTSYPVPAAFAAKANLTPADYKTLYDRSISDRDGFFAEQAKRVQWMTAPTHVGSWSFDSPVKIEWYKDGVLNVTESCLDRHLDARGDKVAIIFEGDEPGDSTTYTYTELHREVCRFANVLRDRGAKKGDRITIYMPMIPEAAFAMLACARIGAVHSVVFGGFSPDALAGRIVDCDSTLVITADEGVRGGRKVPLKVNADAACEIAAKAGVTVKTQLVVQRTGATIAWQTGRDIWLHEATKTVVDDCDPEPMSAEDPLFILYTSGSTGQPKGVLHTCGGYLVWAAMTHDYVFDLKEDDVYWCAADVGWVTGHTYIVYGPLANGTTTVMFEGVPTYPDASRFWQVCDDHQVSLFYTAPTAIRALMREGDGPVTATSRKSLRLLGTVGEPINPEAWDWYFNVIGETRCPIIDTWWQTETGGAMIVPLPGTVDMKPGAGTFPMFGVEPALVDAEGQTLHGTAEGNLILKTSWPGQMRTVYGDHARFEQTYFSTYPGNYFTGDGARRDADGTIWITGRVDDVINVSGHRMGTAEVESALGSHPAVAESAVVGFPHDIKGQGIYAYVTIIAGVDATDELRRDLVKHVRKEIGPIASPDMIQFSSGLPKTRSGKIMRRILRKIAANEYGNLGDTSTLADPSVVEALIDGRAIL